VLVVPSRQLWTPRSPLADLRDWWVMFTQGKRQRDTNGKRKRNTSGKAIQNSATNDACCCGTCNTLVCSPSTGTITVTFSGLVACNSPTKVDFDPNGTWDLPFYSGSTTTCVWELQSIGHTTAFIQGFGPAGTDVFLLVLFFRSGGFVNLTVRMGINPSTPGDTSLFGSSTFIGTEPADCTTTFVEPNINSSCAGATPLFRSGTVTVN
jgi:hypothetical protein